MGIQKQDSVEYLSQFIIYRISALERCSCKGSAIVHICACVWGVLLKGFIGLRAWDNKRALNQSLQKIKYLHCFSCNCTKNMWEYSIRGFIGLRVQGQ